MGIFANLLSKKMNRQVETYQQELVQTHYQEVENMYRQMRGWRHDWRNHLQALKIYAAKGDLPGIQRYLDELDTSLSALDMAIEASAKLPPEERLIRVYMDMKGSQLYISFTNFTAGKKMVKREGRFATTKGAGHGLGLMRIDSIVERLDGYVNRNSEDGAFTTEILLPQQEEPSSGEAAATQL